MNKISLMQSLKVCVAFICILALIACGSNNQGSSQNANNQGGQSGETDGKAASQKAVTIELWHYWGGPQKEVMDRYVKEFNSSQSEVKVNATYIDYGEYTKKLLVSAAGGQLPDILVYGNNETAIYADAGVVEDISDRVDLWGKADQLFDGVRDSHRYDGKYYGLPIYANCLTLFYNKDLVPNPPKTWDELIQISKQVATKNRYGLAVSAVSTEEGTFQWLPFLWSTGKDLDSLDTPEAAKALQLWKGMVDQGLMSKEVVNWKQEDALTAFQTGRAAMMINGPWNVPPLQKAADNLKWGLTQIPMDQQFASILGGESLAIGKGKNADAAWKFMQWILDDKQVMRLMKDRGDLPARKDLAQDPYYQQDPIKKAFVDQLLVAKPRAYGPKYNEMSKAIQDAIAQALSGAKTPEAALKEASQVIKPLLNK